MDIQKFGQRSSQAVAVAERSRFTGRIECRVYYRNAKPRRSFVRTLSASMLCRTPVASPDAPLLAIHKLERHLTRDGGQNEDSEISVTYHFFQGTVVDTQMEVINHFV